jgi:DNA-directed RNA polymerase III subunit RPC3
MLGRLVAERYGDQVQSAGSIVTAALKFCAHKEHVVTKKLLAVLASSSSSSTNTSATEEAKHRLLEDKAMFTPDDIMPYLPAPVLANFKSKAGGARSNLSSSLLKLCKVTYPQTIIHVEDSKTLADGGKFEIATRQLVTYLKNRCFHQMVLDRYGEIAARICSVLEVKGHLESEAVADNAMVFVKDAREILHKLYKENFISMLYLQQGKQHNPKSAIYLWNIDKKRTMRTFFRDVCRAIINLRLRRQHEMQVGKDWIERAKEAGATDENDSELDRVHYHRFCQGLERLDNACLQLDETVMILNDFDN